MKKLFLILITFGLFATANAQEHFSFGLVGTRFSNTDNNNKLTEIEKPFGYGIILGYTINPNVTIALTSEYFNDNMENLAGEETDYRMHLSAYYMPADFAGIKPYLSAGIVYTNRNYDYSLGEDDTDNIFNGRIGAGLDYSLISNISLNADLGFYTDGLRFVGWTSSLGLRYALEL